MYIRKYSPLFAPDNEGTPGGESGETVLDTPTDTPDPGAGGGGAEDADGAGDGPGSGRSDIRKSLEKGFSDANKRAEKPLKPSKGRAKSGSTFDQARERQGATDTPVEGADDGAAEGDADAAVAAIPEGFVTTPEDWAKTPPTVQAAISKRLEETANGVKQIQAKYADIDKALAPHVEAIRRHGHTPAQAVNQLFQWFQVLAANPGQAFPALAKSFNYDWNKIRMVGLDGKQQQDQQATPKLGADGKPVAAVEGQPPGDTPPAIQQYINQLHEQMGMLTDKVDQRFGTIEQSFQQQQEARTESELATWSQGKTYFEDVRQLMAHFIQSGAVPLKDGKVDLDGAYKMAIFADENVRTKVLAADEAAKKAAAKKAADDAAKARQVQADKARRAGVSLGGGAPGMPGTTQAAKKGPRKSVRESLADAIAEVAEG